MNSAQLSQIGSLVIDIAGLLGIFLLYLDSQRRRAENVLRDREATAGNLREAEETLERLEGRIHTLIVVLISLFIPGVIIQIPNIFDCR